MEVLTILQNVIAFTPDRREKPRAAMGALACQRRCEEAFHSSVVRDLMRRDDFLDPRHRIADGPGWPQTGPAPMHFPI